MRSTLLLLAALASTGGAAEPVVWKFAPGRLWKVVVERETTTETTQPGGAGKTTSKTILDASWTVESVDGEVAQIKQTIDRVRATVDVAATDGRKKSTKQERAEFDSASTARVIQAASKKLKARWDPLVGSSTTFSLDVRGQAKGDAATPFAPTPPLDLPPDGEWTSETTTQFAGQGVKLPFVWRRSGDGSGTTVAWSGVATAKFPPRAPDADGPTPATIGQTIAVDFSLEPGMANKIESTTTIVAKDTLRDKPIDTKTIVRTTAVFSPADSQTPPTGDAASE